MFAIAKKELHTFFNGLTGYITIILFLIVSAVYLFLLRDSNLFDFGYATLSAFFELAPWLFIFLIPAISMRTFSDEYRSGNFETLKTRPLTPLNIVLGKFFAVIMVIIIALLPTLLYVVTISSLASEGGIDSGGIIGAYIGLFFLAAVFAAISMWCSSLTSNAVIVFLISAFACMVLYFGFGALSNLPVFQGNGDYYIQMAGIDFHYQSISRGVVDTRDLIYFLSFIFLFLFAAKQNIQNR